MFAPVAIVTLALPDCSGSSALMATICRVFGDGAAPGAVYVPLASMAPQTAPAEHAVPCTCHTTLWLLVTSTRLITVICAVALLVVSATLAACTVTGFGVGIAPGA